MIPAALPLARIPMNFAVVCLNCSDVFDLRALACTGCAGESFVPLAKWLDRQRMGERA